VTRLTPTDLRATALRDCVMQILPAWRTDTRRTRVRVPGSTSSGMLHNALKICPAVTIQLALTSIAALCIDNVEV